MFPSFLCFLAGPMSYFHTLLVPSTLEDLPSHIMGKCDGLVLSTLLYED